MTAIRLCPRCGQPRASCECLAKQVFSEAVDAAATENSVRARTPKSPGASRAVIGHVIFYGVVPLATAAVIGGLVMMANRAPGPGEPHPPSAATATAPTPPAPNPSPEAWRVLADPSKPPEERHKAASE